MTANNTRWIYGFYAAGAAYPEDWIRIEETPGARLVANLPPYRHFDAKAIVEAHNAPLDCPGHGRQHTGRPVGTYCCANCHWTPTLYPDCASR